MRDESRQKTQKRQLTTSVLPPRVCECVRITLIRVATHTQTYTKAVSKTTQ